MSEYDFSGLRIRKQNDPTLYLVLNGERRKILDDEQNGLLFRGDETTLIKRDEVVDDFPLGEPFVRETQIIQNVEDQHTNGALFFYTGTVRHFISATAFDYYYFKSWRVPNYQNSTVKKLQPTVFFSIPEAPRLKVAIDKNAAVIDGSISKD